MTTSASGKPSGNQSTILLVEDNPAHAELIFRTLQEYHDAGKIYHVSDGEQALDYLFRRGNYADPDVWPRPHVILLDLRLPKVDGLEVLSTIKQSPELKKIPVVILTTSSAEQDVSRAYEQCANSYLVKPLNFEKFKKLMEGFGSYWLGCNYYPWAGRSKTSSQL